MLPWADCGVWFAGITLLNGTLSTTITLLSQQNENVRFVQSRNVRFHRHP